MIYEQRVFQQMLQEINFYNSQWLYDCPSEKISLVKFVYSRTQILSVWMCKCCQNICEEDIHNLTSNFQHMKIFLSRIHHIYQALCECKSKSFLWLARSNFGTIAHPETMLFFKSIGQNLAVYSELINS